MTGVSGRRRPGPIVGSAGPVRLGYVRGSGAMLAVLAVVSVAEVIALHLMLPWPWARAVTDLLGLAATVAIVVAGWLIPCRRPHLVGPTEVTLRQGNAVLAVIPRERIGAVRRHRGHPGGGPAVAGDVLTIPGVDDPDLALAALAALAAPTAPGNR